MTGYRRVGDGATPRAYTRGARRYDVLSGELIYRAGRRAGVSALRVHRGDTVLDLGCGTGLNIPLLRAAAGPTGKVIGLDRSAAMLEVARHKARTQGWGNVTFVHADATEFGSCDLDGATVDAVLSTYAMSVFPDPAAAWRNARSVVRFGGRACIVDMQDPLGAARILKPIARLICAAGGSDLDAHPWQLLEADAREVTKQVLRGGHIVVAAGSLG